MTDPVHEESLAKPRPGSTLTMEREFEAPRESVWLAWTDPDRIRLWWGPEGSTTPACRVSLRVGGAFFVCSRLPPGRDICMTAFYREIETPGRLVMSMGFADLQGNIVPAATYGLGPDFPEEMLLTVTFAEAGKNTRMTVTQAGLPAGKTMDDTREGWRQSFDKLAAALAAAQGPGAA